MYSFAWDSLVCTVLTGNHQINVFQVQLNVSLNMSCKSCLFNMFLCSIKIGKDQVAVGLAPINFDNKSSESALSIYPIAIGNCKEKRLVGT